MPDNSWVLHGAQAGTPSADQAPVDETTPLSPMAISSSGAAPAAAKGGLQGCRKCLLMGLSILGVAGLIAGAIAWGLHRERAGSPSFSSAGVSTDGAQSMQQQQRCASAAGDAWRGHVMHVHLLHGS